MVYKTHMPCNGIEFQYLPSISGSGVDMFEWVGRIAWSMIVNYYGNSPI